MAGQQRWQLRQTGGEITAEVITEFAGPLQALGNLRQLSRMDGDLHSLEYQEGPQGRSAQLTLREDRSGLYQLRQGTDQASVPAILPQHDPLSILLLLCRLPPDGTRTFLAGHQIWLQRLQRSGQEGLIGYRLRPGRATAWVEESGQQLVQLVQPLEQRLLTARLRPTQEPRRSRGKRGRG
jgi:hypothetical protein